MIFFFFSFPLTNVSLLWAGGPTLWGPLFILVLFGLRSAPTIQHRLSFCQTAPPPSPQRKKKTRQWKREKKSEGVEVLIKRDDELRGGWCKSNTCGVMWFRAFWFVIQRWRSELAPYVVRPAKEQKWNYFRFLSLKHLDTIPVWEIKQMRMLLQKVKKFQDKI